MGIFKNKKQTMAEISPRKKAEQKYTTARYNLLVAIIFTAINVLFLVIGNFNYFLFSVFVPYLLVMRGVAYTGKLPEEMYEGYYNQMDFESDSYLYMMIAIAVAILAVFIVCWLLSKKHNVIWLIIATVLFAVDTVVFLAMGFTGESVIDLLFHAWVLYYLISGIVAHYKLKKLPLEEEKTEEPLSEEQITDQSVEM